MLGINVDNILARVEHMVTNAQVSHTFWEKQACKLSYCGSSWVVRVQKVNGAGVTFEVIAPISSPGSDSGVFQQAQMMYINGAKDFLLATLSQEEGKKYLEPTIDTSEKSVDIDLTKSGLKGTNE